MDDYDNLTESFDRAAEALADIAEAMAEAVIQLFAAIRETAEAMAEVIVDLLSPFLAYADGQPPGGEEGGLVGSIAHLRAVWRAEVGAPIRSYMEVFIDAQTGRFGARWMVAAWFLYWMGLGWLLSLLIVGLFQGS